DAHAALLGRARPGCVARLRAGVGGGAPGRPPGDLRGLGPRAAPRGASAGRRRRRRLLRGARGRRMKFYYFHLMPYPLEHGEPSSTAVNPTHSRERFYEAAELIIRAWTEAGPFPFDGRFYRYPFVNPWPRPLQRPHPPVWCPSQGSAETVEWAARRRFPYLMVFTPIRRIAQIYGEYREACERSGYTASRYQLTVNLPI